MTAQRSLWMMRRTLNLRFPNIVDMSRRVKEKWASHDYPRKPLLLGGVPRSSRRAPGSPIRDLSETLMMLLFSRAPRHANASMQLLVALRQHSLAARGKMKYETHEWFTVSL